MSLQIGYLDSNGLPAIKLRVTGTIAFSACDAEAMIDTGFTGFLMLPIRLALPLGLVLCATAGHSLADGTTVTNYIAKGTVSIPPPTGPGPVLLMPDQESVEGSIVLGGESPLVGMGFLRSLDKALVVGKSVVMLMDNSLLPPPEST